MKSKLTFGIRASTSCSDSSVPWKTIPGLRLSDLLSAIFSNATSVPEAFASASLSSEASTFDSNSSKSLSTSVRSTSGWISILSAGILEVVFTEVVGMFCSVVLVVVSSTEDALVVVFEIVEIRDSPAKVEVVSITKKVVVEVVVVVLGKKSQNSKTSQKY